MSIYKISASALYRFAGVLKFFAPSVDEGTKNEINTVRLENKRGKSFAIVTNQKIAAIEYLGPTAEADGAVHVKITDALLTLCMTGGMLTFTVMPEVLISMCQNESGNMCSDCCLWTTDGVLNNWRKWAAPDAVATESVMQWNLHEVEAMIAASPSNNVNFPEFINANKPVTVRDATYDNWVGLFFPSDPSAKAAKLPEWWKA